MASTRRSHPPLEIFQDPLPTCEADTTPDSSFGLHSLSPLDTAPTLLPNFDVFDPLLHHSLPIEAGISPLKQDQPSSSPPRIVFGDKVNISLPPPPAPIFTTDSPMKRRTPPLYQPIAPHQLPGRLYTPTNPTGKENMIPAYQSDNFAEFPDPNPPSKGSKKRTLMEAAPLHERQNNKKPRLEQSTPAVNLPDPKDMPTVEDDGNKPPYSYAVLIGMSILRAPNRRLTLAQIYKWISDTFSYYRASETGWQNSIRHNLSLNKSFIKQERPKDDPGKGNYWAIEPGKEADFLKEKPCRRPASSSGALKSQSHATSEPNLSSSAPLPPPPQKTEVKEVEHVEELSSDATIPASDPALLEDDSDIVMPPPAMRGPLSSPLQAPRSSPPVARRSLSREATPSFGNDLLSSSNHSRSKKRKFNSMNDSGYFSSLESSAMRPHALGNSDRDSIAPRFKRGRAEEELARIRGSSHDTSPSRTRTLLKQPQQQLLSSSPFRATDSALMLPPLTPAMKFKKPNRPPASISPNTNLRNHRNTIRDLIGSPMNTFGDNAPDVTFSPAFNINDDDSFFSFEPGFNIFADSPVARKSLGSPEKRSAKRQKLERAITTASILADITGASSNKPNPALRPPMLGSPIRHRSPSKSPSKLSSFMNSGDFGKDDFFMEMFVEDDPDDFNGLDLLQGFQKIGEKENILPGARKKTKDIKSRDRPVLGARHLSSRF